MAFSSKLCILLLAFLLVTTSHGAPAQRSVERTSTASRHELQHSEHFIKKLAKKVKKAVKKVGKGIEKGVKGIGKGIKKGVEGIGKGIKDIGKKVGHAAVCNPVTKTAFGTAFAAAAKTPALNCPRMTAAEWRLVGCDSPASHRRTRICAPAVFGGVLGKIIRADAMALKVKVLFRNGITRAQLFGTPRGRALVRHELAHIRQQAGVSALVWGYRYFDAYCKAGRSYSRNRFEVDARRFQNDRCFTNRRRLRSPRPSRGGGGGSRGGRPFKLN